MTARIVLFGITGQVGSRLMETLTATGYEVTGIDRARCDLATATAKDIATIIRAVEPQLVINATAYTGVDIAETDTIMATRLNADIPEMLALAAQEQHVPFLHFSTDYVFDGLRGAPYSEEAPTQPVNAYARSKRAGEIGVRHQGGHVFRLQWVYDTRGKNFFLTMKKLLAEREEVRVVADQIGTPTHANCIAHAVTQSTPKLINGSLPADIYHLTAQGHTSWHGFACAIARATGSAARVTPIATPEYPLPAARPKDARLNCNKLMSHGITMSHWQTALTLATSA
ncbi:MAG: dTDP-4-dehydrorhamnose reductase [Rickettsiales bacterium]